MPKYARQGVDELLGAALLVLVASCSQGEPRELGRHSESIIYGRDDRREILEGADSARTRLARSSVALVPAAEFDRLLNGGESPLAGERLGWCPGERFYDQLSLAACSGILLAPDLVLTAGHCIPEGIGCSGLVYVADYHYDMDGGAPAIGMLDSARCESIVVERVDSVLVPEGFDYAVVQLSGPLAGRDLPQFREQAPRLGESVFAVGASAGLPAKITFGSVVNVASLSLGYFDFTGDVFAGGSGSGVYDEGGALLGHHVRGGRDYEVTEQGCLEARVVSEGDAGTSEQGNPIAPIVKSVCEIQPERSFCRRKPEKTAGGIDDVGSTSSAPDAGSASPPATLNPPLTGLPPTNQPSADDDPVLSDLGAGREPLPGVGDSDPTHPPRSKGCSLASSVSSRGQLALGLAFIAAMAKRRRTRQLLG
jgi:hypothetical protein